MRNRSNRGKGRGASSGGRNPKAFKGKQKLQLMCKFCSKLGPFVHCSLCLTDSRCSLCLKCSCEETKCKLHKCCNSCIFCVFERATTKERCKSQYGSENGPIKPVIDAFSVDLSPSAPPVTNVLSVVEGLPVGARLQKFWQEGFESKGGLNPSIQDQASSHQDTSDKERIYQSPHK